MFRCFCVCVCLFVRVCFVSTCLCVATRQAPARTLLAAVLGDEEAPPQPPAPSTHTAQLDGAVLVDHVAAALIQRACVPTDISRDPCAV